MTIRAKMQCQKVTKSLYGEEVELSAVYAEKGPNKSWSYATPSGRITLCITNKDAQDKIKVGGYYLIDFTETTESGE